MYKFLRLQLYLIFYRKPFLKKSVDISVLIWRFLVKDYLIPTILNSFYHNLEYGVGYKWNQTTLRINAGDYVKVRNIKWSFRESIVHIVSLWLFPPWRYFITYVCNVLLYRVASLMYRALTYLLTIIPLKEYKKRFIALRFTI